MHRLTYRHAALAVGTLLAALVVSGLPAWGAPPVRPMPPRPPVVTRQPIITANTLLRAAVVRYDQMLPTERNLAASLAGNPVVTPFSGLPPYSPYLTQVGYWQSVYSLPYSYPMSPYSMSPYSMSPYSMSSYGSGYSGGGSGYSGGGSGSSGDASTSDYNHYYQAVLMAGARLERRNVPTGPLSNLMKAEGGLDWPLALRVLPPATESAELRRQLESRAADLQSQGSGGKVDDRLVRDINRDLDRLTSLLVDKADRLPVSEQAMTDARQFIRKFREALKSVD